MTTYKQMAEAGMAAINADLGESWVSSFDLDAMDLRSPWRCVLGQAYNRLGSITAGYSLGLDRLVGEHEPWGVRAEFSSTHGFSADTARGYRYLDRAWRELISQAQVA